VRVRTDNKLDREEWLCLPGGRVLKADALDHHCAHDLIGCQDVAWDVAGAIVEFDLDQDSASELIRSVEQSAAAPVDRELLDFYRIAYVAFRLGHARLGVKSAPQLEAVAQRYSRKLGDLLQRSGAGNRLQCLVD
jgi:hypothetical protein